jgi:MFS family permease
LLGGEFVSAIGDWLYIVALLVVIYRETGDPILLGLFGAVRSIPYIVLSVPAGVVADRYDRRLVLLVTDLARAACMVGMAVVLVTGGSILALIALSILAACFSTFFYPAIGAYVPNLVKDERQLGPANSAWASLDNLGFVVGPVLGGILVAAGGTTLAFVINALTFLVIAVVLWGLPPSTNVAPITAPDEAPEPSAAAKPEVPARRGPIAGLIALRVVDYAIVGGVGMLTVIIATDVLDAGEAATGYLNAAIGIGGVTGAVVAGALVLRRSLRRPLLVGAAVMAGGSVVLGLATELVVAMLAIILVSGGHLVLEVTGATLLQRVTTDAVRGRAVGLMMTVDTGAEAAGSFLIPALVAGAGTAWVLGVSGFVMAAAVLVSLALIGGAVTRPLNVHEATLGRVLELPLFAGVSSARVERALDRLVEVPIAAGDVVIRQGDAADRFYVIESGTVVVTQAEPGGTKKELRQMGADEVFGELGLLSGAPRSATVTAATDGLLLALDAEAFLDLVGRRTAVRGRLLNRYDQVPAAPPA